MQQTSKAIEISGLEYWYGRNKVLENFSLSLNKGEILGLIGKNGAGKTTVIHLLLGLLKSRKGHVEVLGMNPRHDSIKILDRCGFFPEQGEPYGWMRIKDLFKLGQYSFSKWNSTLCCHLSEQLELDNRKRICDLSRGMQVKVKLIFAMSHDPELLILDEPTNGLDPLSRYDILSIIKSLSVQHKKTVLISSHNLDEIAEISTQICLIHKGKNPLPYSMDTIVNKVSLIEFPSAIVPSQVFFRQVIKTKEIDGKTQCLVMDRSHSDIKEFLSQYDDEVVVRNINLKELFVFMTRNLV